MLKILTAGQVKACDAYTIEHEPIASIDLMERACRAFVTWFTQRFTIVQKVGIVCGPGNNGGDGLGIARLLSDWGYPVKVWVVYGDAKLSADFNANFSRLNGKAELYEIRTETDQGLFADREVLIDALFGSGLSRPTDGLYAQAISCINKTQATRIAIDVPSGLLIDRPSTGVVVRAHFTVSFQIPKIAFLIPESFPFVGDWHLVDIGLSKKFINEAETKNFLVTRKGVRQLIKPRGKFDHKGSHGRGLLVSGSYGKMGACVLGARAALRAGIGLLTVHVPSSGFSVIQSSVPEAMASLDTDEKVISAVGPLDSYDVIGIGPGIGQDQKTKSALASVLKQGKPMVIDADALNIMAADPALKKQIPPNSILTPHPGEFERLVGEWSNDFDRLEKQRALSAETGSVVVLKGAHSSIALPNGTVYFNCTGNPGMATGGSGDVLTGVLTGLLAQGYAADQAAVLGVYLHGLAGDLAKQEKGVHSMIASDLVDQLSEAFRTIIR